MAVSSSRSLVFRRFEVCVEVALHPADEESVRWAVERAAEHAVVEAGLGAEVLRVTALADPL